MDNQVHLSLSLGSDWEQLHQAFFISKTGALKVSSLIYRAEDKLVLHLDETEALLCATFYV